MSEAEAWAVAIEGDRPALVIEHLLEYAVTVEPAPDVLVVTVGDQGPPGPPGAPGSGSGVSYSQDHPPTNPLENETWYNPLTLQLRVYTAAGWKPVSPDGGHF